MCLSNKTISECVLYFALDICTPDSFHSKTQQEIRGFMAQLLDFLWGFLCPHMKLLNFFLLTFGLIFNNLICTIYIFIQKVLTTNALTNQNAEFCSQCYSGVVKSLKMVFNTQRPVLGFIPPANEVWGKVIFSVAFVKNFVHRGGLPHCMLGYPQEADTPPPSRHPPAADTPQSRPPAQCKLGDTGNKRAVRNLLECRIYQSNLSTGLKDIWQLG